MTVCRMCLTSNVKMRTIEHNQLIQTYEQLAKGKLSDVSGRRTVCYVCYALLCRCCHISEMVCRSEEIVADLMGRDIQVTQESNLQPKHNVVRLSVTTMQHVSHDSGTDNAVRVKLESENANDEEVNPTTQVARSRIVFEDDVQVFDGSHEISKENMPKYPQMLPGEGIEDPKNPETLTDQANMDVIVKIESTPDSCNTRVDYVMYQAENDLTDNMPENLKILSQAKEELIVKEEITPDGCRNRIVFEDDANPDMLSGEVDNDIIITEEVIPNISVIGMDKVNVMMKENIPKNLDTMLDHNKNMQQIKDNLEKRKKGSENTVVKGVIIHLPSGEKMFSCQKCNSTFSNRNDLISHIRSHILQPRKCDHCGMKLFTSGSGETPHVCNLTLAVDTPVPAANELTSNQVQEKPKCKKCGKRIPIKAPEKTQPAELDNKYNQPLTSENPETGIKYKTPLKRKNNNKTPELKVKRPKFLMEHNYSTNADLQSKIDANSSGEDHRTP